MMLALLASCLDPVAYGAVPDDHRDDAAAFQRAVDQAIAASAEVCIGPGVWNLERVAGQIGSVRVTGGPVTLRGAGSSTVLRMSGPGHRGDWRALRFQDAHEVVIRDLTIDALEATDTEEQTHLIELAPGTHDVVIANVTLGPMRRADQRIGQGAGGDCLRMLGEIGREVAKVTIVDSRFVDCDRSGIAFQRALHDITLVRNTITGSGDTAIDFEPTGAGAIEDVTMVDLVIDHPRLAQSVFAIALAGIGQDLASRVLIDRAEIQGGGVSMLNVADVEIADSVITSHPQAGEQATISVIRRGTNIRLARNTIARAASAGPGFVIRASHNNGAVPHGLTIEGNTIEQATGHAVIGAISAGGLVVRRNVIDYRADDPRAPLIHASAVIADLDGITVEDNDVRGVPGALVAASPDPNRRVTAVVVRGNRGAAGPALRCFGPASGAAQVRSDTALPDCGAAGEPSERAAPPRAKQ